MPKRPAPVCACAPCCCDHGGSHCRHRGCQVCLPSATPAASEEEGDRD